ncbi:hypothetical protein ACQ7B2_30035, partial [Escherichia coli]
HGYCAHSRTAAGSVNGVLARVPAEVEAHIAARRCPRPEGAADPFAADSVERAAIEAVLA